MQRNMGNIIELICSPSQETHLKFTHSLMQINNLCSNIIMVFLLDFKIFQELQKATLTDCLFCMTKLFSLKPLIMLLFPDLITVL